ncbi:hypothetical protein BDFB_010974, partial [Asbolus verrucosus]
DCLTICRILAIDIFQNRLLKYVLWYVAVFVIVIFLMQTYEFLNYFEVNSFIAYAPSYFGSVLLLFCLLLLPVAIKTIELIFKFVPRWKMDSADKKTEERILTESRHVTFFVIFNVSFGVISGLLYLFPRDCDRNIIYLINLLEKYGFGEEKLVLWTFRVFTPLIAFILSTMPSFQIIYFITQMKFQFYMLLFYVRNIDTDYKHADERNLFYDKNYQ